MAPRQHKSIFWMLAFIFAAKFATTSVALAQAGNSLSGRSERRGQADTPSNDPGSNSIPETVNGPANTDRRRNAEAIIRENDKLRMARSLNQSKEIGRTGDLTGRWITSRDLYPDQNTGEYELILRRDGNNYSGTLNTRTYKEDRPWHLYINVDTQDISFANKTTSPLGNGYYQYKVKCKGRDGNWKICDANLTPSDPPNLHLDYKEQGVSYRLYSGFSHLNLNGDSDYWPSVILVQYNDQPIYTRAVLDKTFGNSAVYSSGNKIAIVRKIGIDKPLLETIHTEEGKYYIGDAEWTSLIDYLPGSMYAPKVQFDYFYAKDLTENQAYEASPCSVQLSDGNEEIQTRTCSIVTVDQVLDVKLAMCKRLYESAKSVEDFKQALKACHAVSQTSRPGGARPTDDPIQVLEAYYYYAQIRESGPEGVRDLMDAWYIYRRYSQMDARFKAGFDRTELERQRLGKLFIDKGDAALAKGLKSEAWDNYVMAANLNFVDITLKLAKLVEKGVLTNKFTDDDFGLHWYLLAGRQGSAEARAKVEAVLAKEYQAVMDEIEKYAQKCRTAKYVVTTNAYGAVVGPTLEVQIEACIRQVKVAYKPALDRIKEVRKKYESGLISELVSH